MKEGFSAWSVDFDGSGDVTADGTIQDDAVDESMLNITNAPSSDNAGYFLKLVDELGEGCPLPYLAAYEAEAASPDEVIARLNVTRPDRQQSDALNKSSGRVWVFEEIGPRHGA